MSETSPTTQVPASKAFSIREAVRTGWRLALDNIWSFFVILLTTWVISLLVNSFADSSDDSRPLLATTISILGAILLVLVQMGFIRVILKIMDGKGKPSVDDFSSSFMQFLRFVGVSLASGILALIGFALLIVPGIIVAIRLQFVSYLVIEKNMGVRAALKRSWAITKGNAWNLFLLGLVLAGIMIAGFLLLGVGLFVAIPLSMFATASVYRKLDALQSSAATPASPATPSSPTA